MNTLRRTSGIFAWSAVVVVAALAFAADPPQDKNAGAIYISKWGLIDISQEQDELIAAQEEVHAETLKLHEKKLQAIQDRYDDQREVLETEIKQIEETRDLAIDRILTPAQRRELAQLRKKSIEEDARNLAEFARLIGPKLGAIATAEKLVLYEGLPHQKLKESVAAERAAKKTIVLDGFDFYAEPITPTPQDLWLLREAAVNLETYRPYGGPKFCGGYHPDWCLQWGEGDSVQRLFLCFGCHEAKLIGSDQPVMADLPKKSYEVLHDALTPYHKNRPAQPRPKERQP